MSIIYNPNPGRGIDGELNVARGSQFYPVDGRSAENGDLAVLLFEVFLHLKNGETVTVNGISFKKVTDNKTHKPKIMIEVTDGTTGTAVKAGALLKKDKEKLTKAIFLLMGHERVTRPIYNKLLEALSILDHIPDLKKEEIETFFKSIADDSKKDPVTIAKGIRDEHSKKAQAAAVVPAERKAASKPQEKQALSADQAQKQYENLTRFFTLNGWAPKTTTTKTFTFSGKTFTLKLEDAADGAKKVVLLVPVEKGEKTLNLSELSTQELKDLREKYGLKITEEMAEALRGGMKLGVPDDGIVSVEDLNAYFETISWYAESHKELLVTELTGDTLLKKAAEVYASSTSFRMVDKETYTAALGALKTGQFKDLYDTVGSDNTIALQTFLDKIANTELKAILEAYAKSQTLDNLNEQALDRLLSLMIALADFSLLPESVKGKMYASAKELAPFPGELTADNIVKWVKGEKIKPITVTTVDATAPTTTDPKKCIVDARALLFKVKTNDYTGGIQKYYPILNPRSSTNTQTVIQTFYDSLEGDRDNLILDYSRLTPKTYGGSGLSRTDLDKALRLLDQVINNPNAPAKLKATALYWKAKFLAAAFEANKGTDKRDKYLTRLETVLDTMDQYVQGGKNKEPIVQALSNQALQLRFDILQTLVDDYKTKATAGIKELDPDQMSGIEAELAKLRERIEKQLKRFETSVGQVEVPEDYPVGKMDSSGGRRVKTAVVSEIAQYVRKTVLKPHPLILYAQQQLFEAPPRGSNVWTLKSGSRSDRQINDFIAKVDTVLETDNNLSFSDALQLKYLQAYLLYNQLIRHHDKAKVEKLIAIAKSLSQMRVDSPFAFGSNGETRLANVLTMMANLAYKFKYEAKGFSKPSKRIETGAKKRDLDRPTSRDSLADQLWKATFAIARERQVLIAFRLPSRPTGQGRNPYIAFEAAQPPLKRFSKARNWYSFMNSDVIVSLTSGKPNRKGDWKATIDLAEGLFD